MNKIRYFGLGLMVSVFILGGKISGFSQETFTITTYYPSPYGAYRELNIYDKETFKDSDATPQNLELTTDGAGNLVLTVVTNPPVNPAQLYFNDSGTSWPASYLKAYLSNGGVTYCADGYLVVNYLNPSKIPVDPGDPLPSSGYYVCLRGYEVW